MPNPIAIDEWPVGDRKEPRAALGITNDAEVAARHGRVDLHRKGLDVLVASWRRLVQDKRRRLLLLVGDGDDAEELRAQLVTLSGDVRWHDHYVTDRAIIREHLAAADVAVLPLGLKDLLSLCLRPWLQDVPSRRLTLPAWRTSPQRASETESSSSLLMTRELWPMVWPALCQTASSRPIWVAQPGSGLSTVFLPTPSEVC